MTSERDAPDAFSGCTKNEAKQRVTQLNSTLWSAVVSRERYMALHQNTLINTKSRSVIWCQGNKMVSICHTFPWGRTCLVNRGNINVLSGRTIPIVFQKAKHHIYLTDCCAAHSHECCKWLPVSALQNTEEQISLWDLSYGKIVIFNSATELRNWVLFWK